MNPGNMSEIDEPIYHVFFTKTSHKQYQKLDKLTQKKVDKAILRLQESPNQPNTERLVGHPEAGYRYRIGNYRMLFDIYPDNEIYILHIWPRGKDYKK